MKDLYVVNRNVETINSTLEALRVHFKEDLNLTRNDRIDVLGEDGVWHSGFFKRHYFRLSEWATGLVSSIELFEIKKDGTPSKKVRYVRNPSKVVRF